RAKNGIEHEVALSDQAFAVLDSVKRIRNDKKLLFTTTGETAVSGWSKAKTDVDEAMLKLARKEHGQDFEIEPWHLHDIRRTVASGMQRIGIEPHVIECVQNRVSVIKAGAGGSYQQHPYEREKCTALEAWGREVDHIVYPQDAVVLTMVRAPALTTS